MGIIRRFNLILPTFSKYRNLSIDRIEYDHDTGIVLNIIRKPLWFWAE
jgi:hypothetical protein